MSETTAQVIDALEQLSAAVASTPKSKFDYRDITSGDCGCVVQVVRRNHLEHPGLLLMKTDPSSRYWGYIIGESQPDIGPGKSYNRMTAPEAKGERGKAEAVRRIGVVIDRLRAAGRRTGDE